jgi:prepilin-type N-terminal cleavage/methylation domain-containing protein
VREYLPISKSYSQKGFTLIEALVASAVIAILGVALISTIYSILRVTIVSQDTVRAQNLANEKMEALRNMPYASLATQHGAIYPPGAIPDSETDTVGGHKYVVHTYISFVDDPYDGNALGTIPGKPRDIYPFDYKKATIEVKDSNDNKSLAKISTDVSANAAETSDNSGILLLKVVDSQGENVANANVHLTNSTKSPPVDITTITDMNGNLQIPLLPVDNSNHYHIEVSLPSYSTDKTNPDNISGYDPTQPDFNILNQQVTPLTLAIDLLSTMVVNVVNETGAPVPNLNVTVLGDKVTYADPKGVKPNIHKFSNTFPTNAAGSITISNLEWDSYQLTVPNGYYVISTTPYQKFSVPANISTIATLKVTTDSSWPAVSQAMPDSGPNNTSVSVEVIGKNLPIGSTIELRKNGQNSVSASSVISSDSNTKLTGTFNLTNIATGTWDLVVTAGGKATIQSGGFEVTLP